MNEDKACEHAWESLPRWQGRYRCKKCKAVGYRGLMKTGGRKTQRNQILPYRCSKRIRVGDKRVPCPYLAVSKNDKRAWVCIEHGGEPPETEDDLAEWTS